MSTFYSVDGIESREALTTAIVNDFVTASETFRQVMGVSPEFTGRIPYILELIKTASNLEGESILSASTAELRRSVVNALKDMYKIDSFTELDANLLCFDFKLLFNNNHTICVEELR